jgi:MoxR-like ATPase
MICCEPTDGVLRYENQTNDRGQTRPIIIITATMKRNCYVFLRRCFFHYIRFPDKETMEEIVEVHFSPQKELLSEGSNAFMDLREVVGSAVPSTSELLTG